MSPAARVEAEIDLPGSKSYSNRALLLASLGEGRSELMRALFSDDTRYMHRALTALGIRVDADECGQRYEVEGGAGAFPSRGAALSVGNAGTAARFLTAALAIGDGVFSVDGSSRMRGRPIEPLLNGLRQLGVDIRSRFGNGCPPVDIRASGIPGGRARVKGDISSQFLSALLMAAPYARRDVSLEVDGDLVSAPYVDLTLDAMRAFGVHVDRDGDHRFRVAAGQRYRGRAYEIEPDASGASYFFAAAAVTGGHVRGAPPGTRLRAGRSGAARRSGAHGDARSPATTMPSICGDRNGFGPSMRTSRGWATSPRHS